MKYQLCMVDEYGQNSIMSSSTNIFNLVSQGKDFVTEANVNNALTSDEKKRNWETFFVEFDDENIIYAGKDNKGIDIVYVVDKSGDLEIISLADIEDKVKIFLGILDRKPWYAFDEKNEEINKITHRDLMAKTSYFIRKI